MGDVYCVVVRVGVEGPMHCNSLLESPGGFPSSSPVPASLSKVTISSRSGHLGTLSLIHGSPGIDVRRKRPDYQDRTPLLLATEEGHLEVVRVLLENGAALAAVWHREFIGSHLRSLYLRWHG